MIIQILSIILASLLWTASAFAQYPVNITTVSDKNLLEMIRNVEKIQKALGEDKVDGAYQSEHIARIRKVIDASKEVEFKLTQIKSITEMGQILQKYPDGSIKSTEAKGYSFDGKSLSGGGMGYADNIKGISGLPIGMDQVLPASITPISSTAMVQLSNMSQKFLSSSNAASILQNNLIGLAPYAQSVVSSAISSYLGQQLGSSTSSNLASALSSSVLGSNVMTLGDGVYVRPSSNLDSIFTSAFASGAATDLVNAMTQSMGSNGTSTYSPVLGTTSIPGVGANIADITSGGRWEAVQAYVVTNGGSNYITDVVLNNKQYVISSILNTEVGQPVVLTPTSAKNNGVYYLDDMKPIFQLAGGAGNVSNGYVIAASAKGQTANAFNGEMDANKKRITDNYTSEQFNQAVLEYQSDALKQLSKCRDELSKLRDEMTKDSSVAAVTTALQLCDLMILQRQDRVVELKRSVQERREERHNLLVEREKTRKKYVDRANIEAADSSLVIQNVLSGSSSSSTSTSSL